MLGFQNNPTINGGSGTQLSEWPFNPVMDRYLLVTCDQAKGINTPYDVIANQPWHDGIVAMVPLGISPVIGSIVNYDTDDDAPWGAIPALHKTFFGAAINDELLTFHISRNRYRYFGPTHVYYTLLIEVR